MARQLPAVDVDGMVAFLVELLNIPSPTGDTERAMSVIQEAFAELPLALELAQKGYLSGTPPGARKRAEALTAHADTLGAMVSRSKNGRLRLTQLAAGSGTRWKARG